MEIQIMLLLLVNSLKRSIMHLYWFYFVSIIVLDSSRYSISRFYRELYHFEILLNSSYCILENMEYFPFSIGFLWRSTTLCSSYFLSSNSWSFCSLESWTSWYSYSAYFTLYMEWWCMNETPLINSNMFHFLLIMKSFYYGLNIKRHFVLFLKAHLRMNASRLKLSLM